MKECKRLLAVLLALSILSGCTPLTKRLGKGPETTRYQKVYLDAFDTVSTVTLYADSAERAEECFAVLHEWLLFYHREFDIYHTYDGVNNLCTVNNRAGAAPVAVDAVLLELLVYAKRMAVLTGGCMNIAMGSVLRLWHDARESGLNDPAQAALPSMKALDAAALHMDIDHLVLDETAGTVFLADPEMRLDAGGIAKGFAAQKIVDIMAAEYGVTSMLLNIGGNVCALGTRGDGDDWHVAVQSPDDPQKKLCTLSIADRSLVTSGIYQRYYTVDGIRYHHIIDPATRMPSARFASVTVLTKDSALGDALSTALFNMPLEEGRTLVESLPNTEALWVDLQGGTESSSGFDAFVVSR